MVLSLWHRPESVEKPSPVEKKYEAAPQVTPTLPPVTLPKPAPEGTAEVPVQQQLVLHQSSQLTCLCVSSTAKPAAREDTVQSNFLPHKSFPEKSPVNGTSEQPPKSNSGAPGVSSYNRFAPKPFTTSAKPFARMFDSPKFNHNLLPNDKPESVPKVGASAMSQTCTLFVKAYGGGMTLDSYVTNRVRAPAR